ncbi:cyclase family protein [Sporomusa sphaeroides]|jgi:arylformamidase|uniref:cyclase family protein n=1 Tax=Sporomusa sphaeroides TaxID=47679 RepID=UPI002C207AD9|nr:cyclase family protein [Sporomusa sphaeroides]HML33081.1 cyclase family protein [Sporomusa sphaeroides]
MKLIDLSMTITEHWRWGYSRSLRHTLENGDDFRTSVLQLPAHAFTHVDTPLHCKQGAPALEQLDVGCYSGEAAVIDLSDSKPDQEITVERIKQHAEHVKSGDIILLKTCWDTRRDPQTKEYWTDAPFVSEAAAVWLYEQKPKAVGFDFPQDVILKQAATYVGCLPMSQSPTHIHLLMKDIVLIEYLAGMSQITQKRIQFLALPLKLAGVEGCPVRAVAIDNWQE